LAQQRTNRNPMAGTTVSVAPAIGRLMP